MPTTNQTARPSTPLPALRGCSMDAHDAYEIVEAFTRLWDVEITGDPRDAIESVLMTGEYLVAGALLQDVCRVAKPPNWWGTFYRDPARVTRARTGFPPAAWFARELRYCTRLVKKGRGDE